MKKILEIALADYGLKEQPGQEVNTPDILNMFSEIGHAWVKTDETAWCSAAVNYWAKEAGLEQSGKLNARSWLDVGQIVDDPQLGDVVIFWRSSPQSWKGHVGLVVSVRDGYVYTLGGNQGNMVCVRPYQESRVLGYRRLTAV